MYVRIVRPGMLSFNRVHSTATPITTLYVGTDVKSDTLGEQLHSMKCFTLTKSLNVYVYEKVFLRVFRWWCCGSLTSPKLPSSQLTSKQIKKCTNFYSNLLCFCWDSLCAAWVCVARHLCTSERKDENSQRSTLEDSSTLFIWWVAVRGMAMMFRSRSCTVLCFYVREKNRKKNGKVHNSSSRANEWMLRKIEAWDGEARDCTSM
jgi:hypothetical protein